MDAQPVGGDDPASARALFDQNVYPILSSDCLSCHSTGDPTTTSGFVSPSAADAYATLMAVPAVLGDFTPGGTPLITAIDFHPLDYTSDQLTKIEQWLAAERAERGL